MRVDQIPASLPVYRQIEQLLKTQPVNRSPEWHKAYKNLVSRETVDIKKLREQPVKK